MGFFKRLVRQFRKPDVFDELTDSFDRNITLAMTPTDHELLDEAKKRKGHISLKAVSDEYDRLMLKRYGRR